VAVGDQHWTRLTRIQPGPGLTGEVNLIAAMLSNTRLDRFILDICVNIQFSSSAELAPWHDRGIVVLVEWTESPDLGAPPFPTIPVPADFSSRDVLASAYMRIGPPDTFNNVVTAPAQENVVRLDARTSRRPPTGGRGSAWVTWSAAAGATVAGIGFGKIMSRALTTQVAP
jgi:hypothetical protein